MVVVSMTKAKKDSKNLFLIETLITNLLIKKRLVVHYDIDTDCVLVIAVQHG